MQVNTIFCINLYIKMYFLFYSELIQQKSYPYIEIVFHTNTLLDNVRILFVILWIKHLG